MIDHIDRSFPLVDLNPQQVEDIPKAKSSNLQKATEKFDHGGPDASQLMLKIMEAISTP